MLTENYYVNTQAATDIGASHLFLYVITLIQRLLQQKKMLFAALLHSSVVTIDNLTGHHSSSHHSSQVILKMQNKEVRAVLA